jgi:hypothetical protein
MIWKVIRLAGIAAVVAATSGTAVSDTRADDSPACPSSTADAYTLTTRALTGPTATDVELRFAAAPGCTPVERVAKVQLKTYDEAGKLVGVKNVTDVAVSDGAAVTTLDRVERGRRVEADVLVQTGSPPRTYVLRRDMKSLLRPDLAVEPIQRLQTLTTRPVAVQAEIAELNGDVGTTAKVTLAPLAGPGETKEVTVGAGGHALVDFTALTFTSPVPLELTVTVAEAAPGEANVSNNTGKVTVDVTGHELPQETRTLFPSLVGYGAQFNNHVYAPITPWPADLGYADLEDKVKALEPQLVRIFYNDNWDGNWTTSSIWTPTWQQNYASFVRSVQLAQEAGATIDISFQNLSNAPDTPDASMAAFAAVLEDLVTNHHLTNVRWAEVGNEVNSAEPGTTLDEYNTLVRALDAQLVKRGLRNHIHLMGGGLIERSVAGRKSHYEWLKWIAANMSDVVDAYAEHVYWWYDKPGRLEYRLRDTYNLASRVLPPDQQKPMYMMEFGTRGYDTCGTKPFIKNYHRYYRDDDCTEIWRTNIAAFQQLWFNIASAQLGVAGTTKWDAYWARYDRSSPNNQVYWTIGPPTEGSPLMPSYWAMSLLFHTTKPGWRIVGVDPWSDDDSGVPAYDVAGGGTSTDQPEKELVAYSSPDGEELTVVGLDTHGAALNTAATDPPVPYSIGGLEPNTDFNLAVWNAAGDGTNSVAGTVTTNAAGVARFEVPLQAAFALTTVAVS